MSIGVAPTTLQPAAAATFQDVVGVSAKTLARSIRFEEVRKRLVLDPDQSLPAWPMNKGMPTKPTSYRTSFTGAFERRGNP
jgi:hypothetical protein